MLKIAWFCSLMCSIMSLVMCLFDEAETKTGEVIYEICYILSMIFLVSFSVLTVVLVIEGLFMTVG